MMVNVSLSHVQAGILQVNSHALSMTRCCNTGALDHHTGNIPVNILLDSLKVCNIDIDSMAGSVPPILLLDRSNTDTAANCDHTTPERVRCKLLPDRLI